MSLIVLHPFRDTRKTFPEFPHRLVGDGRTRETVDQIITSITKIPVEGLRSPQILRQIFGHIANDNWLTSFPLVLKQ